MTASAVTDKHPLPLATVALVLLFLVVATLAGLQGGRVVLADLDYTRLRTEVGFWGRDGYRPAPALMTRTTTALERLVASSPGQPDYLALQASALAWQAYYSEDYDEAVELGNRAFQTQLAAQVLRPAHRQGWSKVLEYATRATLGSTAIEESQARLLLLQAPRG